MASLVVAAFVLMHLYTGQVWEDYFITYRHSENLVRGFGLVYQPGERVHGFTSPLNVLLPALFHALNPTGDYVWPLWGFVLVSLGILALGLYAAARWITEAGGRLAGWSGLLLALLLLLQPKLAAFSTNGQEAGLWAGFLLLLLVAINRGVGLCWRSAGLAMAGLMWTRPDSPVHIVALSVAAVIFPVASRREAMVGLAKAALLGGAIYLPWFVWAWVYYGTPVPHTIIAKMGAYSQGGGFLAWLRQWPPAVSRAFEPVYAEAGGWPEWIHVVAMAVGIVCAVLWLIPGKIPAAARRASLAFAVSAGYLAAVGIDGFMFPWYFVPCGVLGAMIFVTVNRENGHPGWAFALALPLVLMLAYETPWALAQARVQQQVIEQQTRTPLGWWLRSHVAENETVFLEPVGYIGYFSQRHILDWPGLVSPSVVRARRETGGNVWDTVARLHPDWLVLRPYDANGFVKEEALAANYHVAAEVNSLPRLQAFASLPGYPYLSSDARFIVYRRVAP